MTQGTICQALLAQSSVVNAAGAGHSTFAGVGLGLCMPVIDSNRTLLNYVHFGHDNARSLWLLVLRPLPLGRFPLLEGLVLPACPGAST